MTKNEIIEKVIDKLLSQRSYLNDKVAELNHNETSFNEKRKTLQESIYGIDDQIDRRISDCEILVK